MDVTEIPDEAWRRLVELENAEHDLDPRVGGYGLLVTANREFPTNRAFARYITTAQSEAAELRKEVERLREDLARRDANENRNCINWGPCSRHDKSMADVDPDASTGCADDRSPLGEAIAATRAQP